MFMAIVMLVGCLPLSVWAEDGEPEISVAEEQGETPASENAEEEAPVQEEEEAEEVEQIEEIGKIEEAEEIEDPPAAEEGAPDFGTVSFRDEYGNESTYLTLTTVQEVEDALLRLDKHPETRNTLVLTLHQDWETKHFLTNQENDIEIDLNEFTWKVTGQDVLETEKAVFIHDGTLTFTKPEGCVITVVDGGLELKKVVFQDCALDEEYLLCAAKMETETYDWVKLDKVEFKDGAVNAQNLIFYTVVQKPAVLSENQEEATEKVLDENQEEAKEEVLDENQEGILALSEEPDGLLGAANPSTAWGKIYTKDVNGKETNVQYAYSDEDAAGRLRVANVYNGSSALIADTIYVELMHDWDTNAYISNPNFNIDVNLNGYKWTVRGGELFSTKQVTIHDGTLSYKGSGSAACMDGGQLNLKNLNVVDSGGASDAALFIIGQSGKVSAPGFIVENVTVSNMTGYSVFGISASNIVAHPTGDLLANNYFKNVTIQNCSANAGPALNTFGTNLNLYFENCRFLNNRAENPDVASKGGAIFVGNNNTNLTFQDCVFDGNEAVHGGAIYLKEEQCNLVLNNTTIQNCKAMYGGAIFTTDDHELFSGNEVNGELMSIIRNCYASDDGGAIYIHGQDVDVSSIRFINNTSYDCGGAVYISEGKEGCDFSYCEFINNAANVKDSAHGGAVYMNSSSQTFDFCLFDHNVGARVPHELYGNKAGNVSNCTFYSNVSQGDLCSDNPIGKNNNVYYYNQRPGIDWNGEGTAEAPYEIESAGALSALAKGVDSGESYQGIYFRQTADITDVTFSIGTAGKKFSGNYDGNGYIITVDIAGIANTGLFSETDGASIKNVVVAGTVIGDTYVGGLVGNAQNTVFQNCINNAAVSGKTDIGGLIGAATACTLQNCVNNGSVTANGSTDAKAGGMIGQTNIGKKSDAGTMWLEYCTNTGAVTAANFAGGMIGTSNQGLTIISCSNSGTVRGDTAGGMVGTADTVAEPIMIQECKNSGRIYGTYAGGIVGHLSTISIGGVPQPNAVQVRSCQNTGRIEGSAAGGIMGGAQPYDKMLLIDGCTNQGTICSSSEHATFYGGGILGKSMSGTIMNCVNGVNARFTTGNVTSYVGGIVGGLVSDSIIVEASGWLYNNLNLANISVSAPTNTSGLLIGAMPGTGEVKNFASHSDSTVQRIAGDAELGEDEKCYIAPISGTVEEINDQMNSIVFSLNRGRPDDSWMVWNYANGSLRLVSNTAAAVTFHYEAGGSQTSYKMNFTKGSKITVPAIISRVGFAINWYTDERLTQPFDFDTVLYKDMHLYGQWECLHDNLTIVKGKEPTDTEFGVLDVWLCPSCGGYFADEECTDFLGGPLGYDLWSKMGNGKIGKLSNKFLRYSGSILELDEYSGYDINYLSRWMTVLGDDSGGTSWYLVDSDMTLSNKLSIQGTVCIIVKDGCTLELTNGIELLDNATLRLFGQSVEPTTGKVIISPNSSNGYAVYAKYGLKTQPKLDVVSAHVITKHSSGKTAISLNVAVSFDAGKTLLIGQDKSGDVKLLLSVVLNAAQGIKNQAIHDIVIGDAEFLPILTGDFSAFKSALQGMVDKIGELRHILDQAQVEASRILPWSDQILPTVKALNDMLNKLQGVEGSLLIKIAELMPGLVSGQSYGQTVDKLLEMGWDVASFPYAKVYNGSLDYIELLGRGDEAVPEDPRAMVQSQPLLPDELFMDTTNLTVLASEYVKLNWPNTVLYNYNPRLALHMSNLPDLLAMGEIQVWMQGKDGEVKQLPAEIDVQSGAIRVTTDGQCAIMIVSDAAKKNPEFCVHENLKMIKEYPATCYREGTKAHYLCTDCGTAFDESKELLEAPEKIPVLTVHRLEIEYGTPATCENTGIADTYRCLDCRKLFADKDGTQVIVKAAAVPALGHKTVKLTQRARPGKDGETYGLCCTCQKKVDVQPISAPAKITAEYRNAKTLLGKLLSALLPKIVVTDAAGNVIPENNYLVVIVGKYATVTFYGKNYTGTMTAKIR